MLAASAGQTFWGVHRDRSGVEGAKVRVVNRKLGEQELKRRQKGKRATLAARPAC